MDNQMSFQFGFSEGKSVACSSGSAKLHRTCTMEQNQISWNWWQNSGRWGTQTFIENNSLNFAPVWLEFLLFLFHILMSIVKLPKSDLGHFWPNRNIRETPSAQNSEIRSVPERVLTGSEELSCIFSNYFCVSCNSKQLPNFFTIFRQFHGI